LHWKFRQRTPELAAHCRQPIQQRLHFF